ncbi:uncharacterized protein EDB91DRAFT_1053467 [Suillus paluster]|uniref:uncharacterized protein n=1 Tax=Suillus paluster TaxID=48578 RepID=UPI001B86A72B|nr:uncharacterized protein EDB91DRAFT_1053467 [Suillus paluster]KAG1739813.1 hypothetical protein EDB91DRAFT_1053467 [Suillus paluster]
MFLKASKLHQFSREDVLHAVAKFVVCDDQSLAVANKATFRNCSVTMRPAAMKADIPSVHDITTYIHSAFLDFFVQLKSDIQVDDFYYHSALVLATD